VAGAVHVEEDLGEGHLAGARLAEVDERERGQLPQGDGFGELEVVAGAVWRWREWVRKG
jgi:hypothetical protein